MKGLHLSGIFRFLAGILLVQVATALLVLAALRLDNPQTWLLLGLFALTLGLVTAFWFSTIAAHAHQKAMARLREQFSREREKIRLRAEREKSRVIQKNQQQLEKDRRKLQSRANTRVTLMFTGLVAAGGLMVFTQFMTFGLLLMTGAGGALAGYLLRIKQQMLPGSRKKTALPAQRPPKLIGKE
jgi:Flp pilus assembly protein TadB